MKKLLRDKSPKLRNLGPSFRAWMDPFSWSNHEAWKSREVRSWCPFEPPQWQVSDKPNNVTRWIMASCQTTDLIWTLRDFIIRHSLVMNSLAEPMQCNELNLIRLILTVPVCSPLSSCHGNRSISYSRQTMVVYRAALIGSYGIPWHMDLGPVVLGLSNAG